MDPTRVIPHINNHHLDSATQRQQLELMTQLNQKHLAERTSDNQLEARIASMEMAFRMQTEAQEAFDLNRESKLTREHYGEKPVRERMPGSPPPGGTWSANGSGVLWWWSALG